MAGDLIDIKYIDTELDTENFCSHDQLGILLVINHIFQTDKEKFGDENIRFCLKEDFDQLISSGSAHENLLGGIADIIDNYNIQPFQNISIAALGLDDEYFNSCRDKKGYVFSDTSSKLISKFSRVIDLNPSRNHGIYVKDSLHYVSNEKVDYVISGNVLNIPALRHSDMIFGGCANIMKAGGQLFHIMSYSDDNYDVVLNRSFHKFLGQKMKDIVDDMNGCITYLHLEQEKETFFNERHLSWFASNFKYKTPNTAEEFILSNPEYLEQNDFPDLVDIYRQLEPNQTFHDHIALALNHPKGNPCTI